MVCVCVCVRARAHVRVWVGGCVSVCICIWVCLCWGWYYRGDVSVEGVWGGVDDCVEQLYVSMGNTCEFPSLFWNI